MADRNTAHVAPEHNTKEDAGMNALENLNVTEVNGIDIEALRRVSPQAAFQLEIDLARKNWTVDAFEFVGGRADRRSTVWRANKSILQGHLITLVDVHLRLSNSNTSPIANVNLRTPCFAIEGIAVFPSQYEDQKYRISWPSRKYEKDGETKYQNFIRFTDESRDGRAAFLRKAHNDIISQAVDQALEAYITANGGTVTSGQEGSGNNPMTD